MIKQDIYLGVDLGGTNIVIAGVTANGKIIKRLSIPTPRPALPKKVISAIILAVKNIEKDLAGLNILGLGVGAAGDIDNQKGVVRISPNLGWHNVHLAQGLRKYFAYPVIVENDANAAAWGAYYLEGKEKIKNLICITLGTGVGGGLVFDGKLYQGTSGSAGEIGHLTLDPNGPPCKCGNNGCLEAYIGANYLKNMVGKTYRRSLQRVGATPELPLQLSKAAERGEEPALKIWRAFGERLGIALANLVNLLNPEMVVLSGGVSQAGKFFLPVLKTVLRQRAFATPVKAVKIVITKFSQDLGVVGAALLAKNN